MKDSSFINDYYEQAWSQTSLSISPEEEERIKGTLALIPKPCLFLRSLELQD
ncbi:unnamed protein product [marine sediment metagenome]|uniref:Uncharacterized protein n=1 Tax=marine sediment metagenome TaxID=412755 RepID=X1U5X3_9ZZZZ